jgi:hypothetical protein
MRVWLGGAERRPAAPLVAAVALAAAASGCGAEDQPRTVATHSTDIARRATWEPLARLPKDLESNALDAQIISVGPRPVIAFVDHSATGRGAITVLALHGKEWLRVGGRSLPPAADRRFFATSRGGAVCVARQARARISEHCAKPDAQAEWTSGPGLHRDGRTTLAAYGNLAGTTVMLTQATARRRAGSSIRRVPTTTAFVLGGGRWNDAGVLDKTGASQRPYLVEFRKLPCVAFNAYTTSGPPRQSVRFRCIANDRRVVAVRIPDFTSARVARVQPRVPATLSRATFGFDVSGAASTSDGRHLWIGIQVLRAATADWVIYEVRPSRSGHYSWVLRRLGERSAENLGQGTIHAIGNEPWTVQFDQLGGTGAIRLSVNRLANGRKVRVGGDLANAPRAFGYPSAGMTNAAGTVYSIATVPNATTRSDELRVWRAKNP